jgi:predicted metal-dependent phosphoesterase TrpH
MHSSLPRSDLQSHSLHSDGELPPAEVVKHAAQAGVELLALTDHDTVDGIDEALEAARTIGIRLLEATEISAVDGDYEDLHVLGYGIRHHDPTLRDHLAGAREDRHVRAVRMIELLRELNFEVDEEQLQTRRAAGKPLGRPHLAAAVLSHPANSARLREEALGDVSSFIPAYLIPGAPAYAGRTRPTVAEAIKWIHEAGGLAVWAHPFWDIESPQEVLAAIDRFTAHGLDGVECFYVAHDNTQNTLLAERCSDLGLISTASSDFHGPKHRLFSRFLAYELGDRSPNLGALGDAVLTEGTRGT